MFVYRVDGRRLLACPAGHRGAPTCIESCTPGQWGVDCGETCRCANGVPCDFATGFCANHACQSGFTGTNCMQGERWCVFQATFVTDMDECASGQVVCAGNAVCHNTFGGFECACANGQMSSDGRSCQSEWVPYVHRVNSQRSTRARRALADRAQ
jgi:hypothetical protein